MPLTGPKSWLPASPSIPMLGPVFGHLWTSLHLFSGCNSYLSPCLVPSFRTLPTSSGGILQLVFKCQFKFNLFCCSFSPTSPPPRPSSSFILSSLLLDHISLIPLKFFLEQTGNSLKPKVTSYSFLCAQHRIDIQYQSWVDEWSHLFLGPHLTFAHWNWCILYASSSTE
jgi:hypothetical protein